MISRVSVAKSRRGGEHPYVAVVDGAEVSSIRFGTRAAALAYAERGCFADKASGSSGSDTSRVARAPTPDMKTPGVL
jgi:hypothetical protein